MHPRGEAEVKAVAVLARLELSDAELAAMARQLSAILDYMQQLRATPNPGPLLPKLKDALADPNQALADHLARADAVPVTARGRVGR